MIDIGYKFKSLTGIHVTVLKQYNTWGSFIVEMRKVSSNGRIEREGVKLVSIEEIKAKTVNFEEDYIKLYTDMMRSEMRRKG